MLIEILGNQVLVAGRRCIRASKRLEGRVREAPRRAAEPVLVYFRQPPLRELIGLFAEAAAEIFLLALAVRDQTIMSQAATVGCFRRCRGAMTPPCPACDGPTKDHGRTFHCEPCREIIIFFAVSDASPYIAAGAVRVHPKSFTVRTIPDRG
jgi:hypothetical protein